MGPCYTCKRTVAFGGVKDHGYRFCSKQCHQVKAGLIDAIARVPAADVAAEAQKIKMGRCARCGESGGVDFHKSMFVWSAIVVTRTNEKTFIGCTSCARKSQALSAAGTALVGWWGFPFGLLFTPAALLINGYQMFRSRSQQQPSPLLHDYARERLAFADKFGSSYGLPDASGRVEPTFS